MGKGFLIALGVLLFAVFSPGKSSAGVPIAEPRPPIGKEADQPGFRLKEDDPLPPGGGPTGETDDRTPQKLPEGSACDEQDSAYSLQDMRMRLSVPFWLDLVELLLN
jgi:hypothetical protein